MKKWSLNSWRKFPAKHIPEYKDQKEAAAVTLYARYLKRVGGHLKNITTTMLNPYEEIGYRPSK